MFFIRRRKQRFFRKKKFFKKIFLRKKNFFFKTSPSHLIPVFFKNFFLIKPIKIFFFSKFFFQSLIYCALLTCYNYITVFFFYTHLIFFFKFRRFFRVNLKKHKFTKHRNFLFLLNLFLLFFFKKPWFFLKFCKKAFWKPKKDNVRKIIYFLRSFFKKFSYFFFKIFQVLGLLIFFKGKINSYGNSRKKIIRLNFGLLNSTQFSINTHTSFCSFINKSGKTKCRLSIFF